MVTIDEVNEVLHWCDLFVFSLAEFVQNVKFPKLVLVDNGYDGGTERSCIGKNEVITMHELRTYHRVVGEDSDGKPITISLDCPVKALVNPLPMLCPYSNLGIDQLQFVHASIKYFRVCSIVDDCESDRSLKVGEVLQLKKIHGVKQYVEFENVATKRQLKITFGCKAIFEPLLDCQQYTVKEVKEKYGFPASIHFLKDNSEKRKEGTNESTKFVKNLGKVNILHKTNTDPRVIATTVVGSGERKTYLELPKDIALQVRVSKEYLLGDDCYLDLVKKLHDEYDPTIVTEANLDKFEYLNETNKNKLVKSYPLNKHTRDGTPPDLPKRNPNMTSKPPSRPPKNLQCGTKNKSRTNAVIVKVTKGIENLNNTGRSLCNQGKPDVPSPSNHGNTECILSDKEFLPSPNQDNAELLPLHNKLAPSSEQDNMGCIPPDHKFLPSSKQNTEYTPPHNKLPPSSNQGYTECLPPSNLGNTKLTPLSNHHGGTASSPSEDQAITLVPTVSSDMKTFNQSTDEDYIWPEVHQRQVLTVTSDSKTFNQSTDEDYIWPEVNQRQVPTVTSDSKTFNQSTDQDYIWPEVHQGQGCTYTDNRKDEVQAGLYETVEFYDDVEPDSHQVATTQAMYCNCPPPSLPELVTANVTKSHVSLCSIPEDLSKLTVQDVGGVLKELGMDCYVSVFNKELIDGEMLLDLDEDAMATLNMSSFHIKKLIKVIAGWRPNLNPSSMNTSL